MGGDWVKNKVQYVQSKQCFKQSCVL